jgi:hypothetical protein
MNPVLNRRIWIGVLLVLSLPVIAHAAVIKTKDGKTIEGQIRGMIVQKGELKIEKSDEGPIHIVSYDMSNGEDIQSIEELGVHRSHIWQITVSAVGGLPDDLDVFKPGEKTGLAANRVTAAGLKYNIFVFDFAPRVPSTLKLLGEFRNENGKDVIIPSLHVTTKDGAVDIPVADLVTFKDAPKNNP